MGLSPFPLATPLSVISEIYFVLIRR